MSTDVRENVTSISVQQRAESLIRDLDALYEKIEGMTRPRVTSVAIDNMKHAEILLRNDRATLEDVIMARALLAKTRIEIQAASQHEDESFSVRFAGVVYGVCAATVVVCALVYWYFNPDLNGGESLGRTFVGVPAFVWIWSAIGTITAMLLRASEIRLEGWGVASRWLMCRPVVGISTGVLLYLVLQAGLLVVSSASSENAVPRPELLYLISYLGGFSDTVSVAIIQRLMGQFSGMPISPTNQNKVANLS
jgi:hypothetical protein